MSPPLFIDHERHLRAIMNAALAAADPRARTGEALTRHPPRRDRFALIAVGKAAAAMWQGLADARPGRSEGPGASLMVVPGGSRAPAWALRGDHPLPTERSEAAGRAIEEFVDAFHNEAGPDAGFVVLLSGGGSSLMMCPDERVGVAAVRELNDAMLRAGATIHELNCVRKHLDRLKGGKLAARIAPRWCDVYALSDVLGDDVSVIGSGPCAPDPTTFLDALTLAKRAMMPALTEHGKRPLPEGDFTSLEYLYDGYRAVNFLYQGYKRGEDETPKPGDPVFDRVRHFIVANNATAVDAAAAEARKLGFMLARVGHDAAGEAATTGRELAAEVRAFADPRPACVVMGGETTVTVGRASGKGGRNQELALAAAIALDGASNAAIAAFATDGVDGPTDAAGAIVTGETHARARRVGCDPPDSLKRHDSYTFFERVGGHIKTGPTGTNVNDLAIALMY